MILSNYTWNLYSIYRRMESRDEFGNGICAFKKTSECKSRGGKWNWKCEMETAHFHVKSKFNTKYDKNNNDPSCIYCHKYMHDNTREHRAFKLEQIGLKECKKLLIASQILVRKSDKRIKETALRSWLREKIKELEKL